jgi:gliding motility-associated-like protein
MQRNLNMSLAKCLTFLVLVCSALFPSAQTPLYTEVLISDVGTNNTIGHANTSRNLTVASDGTIYAVFSGSQGIRVAKSTNRGQSFLPSVQVSPTLLAPTSSLVSGEEAEIEVSGNGTVYVAWNQGLTMYFSYSTDGGTTFSTPTVVGTPTLSNLSQPSGNVPHMACYGNNVYLLPQSSRLLYRNNNNGVGAFSSTPVGTNVQWYFSDVRVDQNGDVYVVVDNPIVYLFRSTDNGATFNEVNLSPRPNVSYSSYCLIAGSFGSYIFTGGNGAVGNRINLSNGATDGIALVPNSNAFGRSLLADEFGNVVDGYISGSTLGIRVSYNQGQTWQPSINVASGEISNIFRNYQYQDVLVAYKKNNGQVYLAVYPNLLLGLTSFTRDENVCAGESITVIYNALGPFAAGNKFTAQLSDANGNFANAVNIGSVTSTTTGSLAVVIPPNTPSGTNYRIRVKSSSPELFGTDNGSNLTVNSNAAANFTFATQQCEGSPVAFTNTSTAPPTGFTSQWTFGTLGSSAQTSPSFLFPPGGPYDVKLVNTTAQGCKDSITKQVTVGAKPQPAFGINTATQCIATNNFVFTNATPNPGVFTYSWKFGDGATTAGLNTSHTYSTVGTYTVTLIATAANGCSDSIKHNVTVNTSTNPSFTINAATQCLGSNNFVFTNTTPPGSTYLWYFGDGGTSTAASPSHVYNATNPSYSVKLIATAAGGCKDSVEATVTVNPQSQPSFTSPSVVAQCLNGNSYTFTNTSANPAGITYQWAFGDGITASGLTASHAYTVAGLYNVKLYATTPLGCLDSANYLLTVHPKPNVAFINNNPEQCLATNHFTFTNTTTLGSGTMSQVWYYGDGNTSTGVNGDHTYTIFGNYTVKLRVVSDMGCKDSSSQSISFLPKPVPVFTINDAGQCLTGNGFTFTDASSITAGSFTREWRYGDGGTATSVNGSRSYATANAYEVALILVSDRGCTDTLRKTVNVYPMPIANFTVNNVAQCVNVDAFTFTNGSTIGSGSMTYAWTFGDGGTSAVQSPTYSYTVPSNYTVQLVATSDQGCIGTKTAPVQVYTQPQPASFTINQAEQCFTANNFTFTNTSPATGGSLTYKWLYGDGTEGSTQHGNRVYAAIGEYTVKLVSINANGCVSDTMSQVVKVHPEPTVDLGADRIVLEGLGINLNPIVTGTGLTFQWTPDRYLSNNTQENPLVTPSDNVAYTLTVTGPGGCTDHDDITLTILKKLVVPNAFSPNGDGVNDKWVIPHLDIYPGCVVEIYSRNGQLIYRSTGYAMPWDGKIKGSLLPVGTYYYVIDPKNGRTKFTGSLTLIR